MTRKSHQAAAVLATGSICLLARHFKPEISSLDCSIAIAVSAYAALVPDFDTTESYISRSLLGILFLPVWILQAVIRALSHIPWRGQEFFKRAAVHVKHRGFSHYPAVWLALFAIIRAVTTPIVHGAGIPMHLVFAARFGAFSGIYSHIVADTAFGGLCLLYPFSNKRIRFTPWRTGSVAEDLSFVVFLLLDFLVCKSLFL
jgi:hypothetical protein